MHWSILHFQISRRRVTAADARLIWQHFKAAGQAAAPALTIMRGYSLSTFYNIIRVQGIVCGAYLHPGDEKKWMDQ
jgi:hypothetical protein